MRETNDWPSRIVITDLLPAGFEIDNPNLVDSAQMTNFDWIGEISAAHTEFRYDRFVAAFNRAAGDNREFNVAYVVRAVTPGTYDHPAANVEDMYRPELSARTATGKMEVVTAQPWLTVYFNKTGGNEADMLADRPAAYASNRLSWREAFS